MRPAWEISMARTGAWHWAWGMTRGAGIDDGTFDLKIGAAAAAREGRKPTRPPSK